MFNMNRREFTFRMAAVAATPALPVPALAANFEPSKRATQVYRWAEVISRSHNKCSPEMLQRLLKIDGTVANELQRMLLDKGVITNAVNGISMATKPLNTNCVPKQALKPTNINQSIRKAVDVVEKHVTINESEDNSVPEGSVEPEEKLSN